MTLEKINPLLYITDRDPIPEEVLDTSSWFKTETMELDFGEYVGRPSENVTMHKDYLSYFFAQGWYVDAVLGKGSGGVWKSVASSSASQNSNSNSNSSGSSNSNSKAESESNANGGSNSEFGSSYSSSSGKSEGSSSGQSNSSGSSFESGNSHTYTDQDGGPYWYAYQRIRLKRRKMQSELVLKDMIAQFTKAYNEGREINDERYDELVSLYALMLSRTEDEANAFAGLNADDFKPLAKAVTDAVKDALENYKNSVSDLPDDWMQSRIDEINRRFDALVSQKLSEMISNGTYNGTVWPSVESGIERDRQYALNDLKDEMVNTKVEVYGKIAAMTADVGKNLLDCEIRIIEAQQKMLIGPTEIRNTVFKWMLDFMERRDDDYPGLDQIATVASTLGYAEGATGGANT